MSLDRTWYNTLFDDSGAAIPDGTEVDKAFIDHIYDDVDVELVRLDAKTAPIACLLMNTSAISWGTGVWADFPFDLESYDPLNLHVPPDLGGVVIATPGTYGIHATVVWPPSTAGVRGIVIAVNGVWPTSNLFDLPFNGGAGIGVTSRATAVLRLAATNRVSLQLYQNGGGAELIPASGARLHVWRISP